MKKVLAVDDDAAILRCLDQALGSRGYKVLTTSSPLKIAGMVLSERPDLIILDVVMPERDGIALFDDLKARNRLTPILFLTGNQAAFDLSSRSTLRSWETYFGDGNVDILYKPFKFPALFTKVEMLIGPPESPA